MEKKNLNLTLAAKSGNNLLELSIERLIVAGWTGKDEATVQEHIEELEKLGVPAPTRTPTFMNLAPSIISTGTTMNVVSPESSGEVECVLFRSQGMTYVGVGSDHTDRAFEKFDIPGAKQMCPKPVAPLVWTLEEVKDHLDKIVLRSWMMVDGKRRDYQEGTLGDNLNVLDIMGSIPVEDGLGLDNFCLFCGTFAAKGGIAYGELFEFEMEDRVLGRKVNHAYRIRCLPQYL